MKNMLKEFKEFLSQGDIVMIAVGLVMALAFKTIIDNFIDGVINPIIAAIFGEPDMNNIGFAIGDARLKIGMVFNAIIYFVVVGFVLYLILKAWERMKPRKPEAAPSELDVLVQIRDELRSGR
jgi:large conductance mechanosensitive channel